MKIRHRVIKSIRDFFDKNDFVLIDSPIFTSNAVEGTTNLLKLNTLNGLHTLLKVGNYIKRLEQ